MPNHLVNATSPYLLQHANNPVDWYPWGPEALSKASAENKVIFLSIGYAACHWCHVMAHESFENRRTAAILNEDFVSIKVDREERPDLDAIYMQATMILTGSGGWPMSVFLTPDLRPFYAGTYFPPRPLYNLPSFTEVLQSIAQTWKERPDDLARVAAKVIQRIDTQDRGRPKVAITQPLLEGACSLLIDTHDSEYGGWGTAPKFPQPMIIEFLLRRSVGSNPDRSALDVALFNLKAMARGGMYDVVGGGFSRYSTDNHWHIPHFEKMLYDNAQLSLAYMHAWLITREPMYQRVAIETLDFVIREMRHPGGGFFSSLDADSEGAEGKFYLWTPTEIRAALSDDDLFEFFSAAYGLSGNDDPQILQRAFDDQSLASRFHSDTAAIVARLAEAHSRLLAARASRVRPGTDNKIITAWNGLMLRAFAQASRFVRDESRREVYLRVAIRNANFLLDFLRPESRLRRAWNNGSVSEVVFLEDFAALILGLLDLYQAGFDNRWFVTARQLADEMLERFSDPAGGFFDTPHDAESLPVRPKDLQDNATPSGNALACEALLKLAAFTGQDEYRALAEAALAQTIDNALRVPTAFGQWLNAADFALAGDEQLALVFPSAVPARSLLDVVNATYRPNLVVAGSSFPPTNEAPALLSDRPLINSQPTAYVCRHFACDLPITEPADLKRAL